MKITATSFLLIFLICTPLDTQAGEAYSATLYIEEEHTHQNEQACVILLHGMGRTHRSMSRIQNALKTHGYGTSNIPYNSRTGTIEELAPSSINRGLEQCRKLSEGPIHFVTHSLGGILLRYYLATNSIPELGRVVMMAPPNHGSEIIDTFGKIPGFFLLSGRPGRQLGTRAEDSIPLQLPPVDFELGVIAGDRSLNPLFSWFIPAEDDGKISVESARTEGMSDFVVMPYTHTFMMQRQKVIDQILHFLETGRFHDHDR